MSNEPENSRISGMCSSIFPICLIVVISGGVAGCNQSNGVIDTFTKPKNYYYL